MPNFGTISFAVLVLTACGSDRSRSETRAQMPACAELSTENCVGVALALLDGNDIESATRALTAACERGKTDCPTVVLTLSRYIDSGQGNRDHLLPLLEQVMTPCKHDPTPCILVAVSRTDSQNDVRASARVLRILCKSDPTVCTDAALHPDLEGRFASSLRASMVRMVCGPNMSEPLRCVRLADALDKLALTNVVVLDSRACEESRLACEHAFVQYATGRRSSVSAQVSEVAVREFEHYASTIGRTCRHGKGSKCRLRAIGFLAGGGLPASEQIAFALFSEGCLSRDGSSCTEAGRRELARSPERAFRFFDTACELEHAEGCKHLAESYRAGLGTKPNEYRAHHYMQKACDLGLRPACNSPVLSQ